jgi:streptogramin lyase
MKNNQSIPYSVPANFSRFARLAISAQFVGALMTTTAFAAPAKSRISTTTASHLLAPGDIVFADSGDAVNGGFLVKVDPATGLKTVISSGGSLRTPFDVTIDATGQLVVSDCGRLLRVDPDTGTQNVLADNSLGTLGIPYGLCLNGAGQVLAANMAAVVQVDPLTGQTATVSSGGSFRCPLGVAAAANGELFVLNMAYPPQILRVNPQNGGQKLVTQGGFLNRPQSITISGADIYVTDVATPDGNFGVGRVIHVDAHTGSQTVVAQGGYLVGPVGIAVNQNGQLVVGDPYTVNPQSPDLASGGYDGAIIQIDPATGEQTLLARGEGSFVNPRGVVIVPLVSAGSTVSAAN